MRIVYESWNWQRKILSKLSNSLCDVHEFQANFTYAKTVSPSVTTVYRNVLFLTLFTESIHAPRGSYPHFLSCFLKIHLSIVLLLPSSLLFSCFPTKILYADYVSHAFFWNVYLTYLSSWHSRLVLRLANVLKASTWHKKEKLCIKTK